MSKRTRESRSSSLTSSNAGRKKLSAAVRSLEHEIQKISLWKSTNGGGKTAEERHLSRWGDADDDALPPTPLLNKLPPRSPRSPPLPMASLPQSPTAAATPRTEASSPHSSSTTMSSAARAKRLKTREVPTPEFSVAGSGSGGFGIAGGGSSAGATDDFFDERDLNWNITDHASVFKWARDEDPPLSISPPKKGRDEIDPGNAPGASPVEKSSRFFGGRTWSPGFLNFRPIRANTSFAPLERQRPIDVLVEQESSEDESGMFVEDDEEEEEKREDEAQKPIIFVSTKSAKNLGKEDDDSTSAPVVRRSSRSVSVPPLPPPRSQNELRKQPTIATMTKVNEDTGGDAPIIIPIATLVESKQEDKSGREEKRAPVYERRCFWIFVVAQLIVVAGVVVVVLTLRRDNDKNGSDEIVSPPTAAGPTPTPTAVLVPPPPTAPSSEMSPTVAPLFVSDETSAPIASTEAQTPSPSAAPTRSPIAGPTPSELEFPNVPEGFRDSYESALQWLGAEEVVVQDPALQRFVLTWLWYYTTHDVFDPWISCNPETDESDSCAFLADPKLTESSELCYETLQSSTRWLSPLDECSWAGITCDATGQVISVKLAGFGLQGGFPFFLNRLSALKELNLSFGGLNGTIPPGISLLSNLEHLNLSHNFLEQPIPDELFSLPLRSLDLSANKFQGEVPPSIGSLSSVVRLHLDDNAFSEQLPDDLSQAVNLEILTLGGNLLKGTTIPSAWGTLVNLRELRMDRNGFSGVVPSQFVSMTQLEKLELQENNLAGDMPSAPWPGLHHLDLHSNLLSGNFPEYLYSHTGVRFVDLSSNKFTGSIRDSFSSAMALRTLNLDDNGFVGFIPYTLTSLPSIHSLRLQYNRFGGSVPADFCNLRDFDINGFRQGLTILEADCLPNRGITDNACGCCTFCCDRATQICREVDDSLLPPDDDGSDQNCMGGTYQWNRVTGRITSF